MTGWPPVRDMSGILKKMDMSGILKKLDMSGIFFWLVNNVQNYKHKCDKTAQQNLRFSPVARVFPSSNITLLLQ